MGLPGIFEVFQLAVGPSMVYTNGALRIGKACHETLLTVPTGRDCRIIFELRGHFASRRAEFRTVQAVVAGIGGYSPGITTGNMLSFYLKIREKGCFAVAGVNFPFNPESDVVFAEETTPSAPDLIRFHIMSPGVGPIYQAEYLSDERGLISGPGIGLDSRTQPVNMQQTWQDVENAIIQSGITIQEFVLSGESNLYGISRDQVLNRMLATWKLMMAAVDRGLKSGGGAVLYRNYLIHVSKNPGIPSDINRPAVYAAALEGEIMGCQPVITAPGCYGSAILPSVLRVVQEKYMISDERMAECMLVCGLFGSLALLKIRGNAGQIGIRRELACSAAMAAAGVAFLTGGSVMETGKAAAMVLLHLGGQPEDHDHDPASFRLNNSSVASIVIPLAELARIEPDADVTGFDRALGQLLRRP